MVARTEQSCELCHRIERQHGAMKSSTNRNNNNVDQRTVSGFGDEWVRFDQSELPAQELHVAFDYLDRRSPADRDRLSGRPIARP